jgi:hypothetical protein
MKAVLFHLENRLLSYKFAVAWKFSSKAGKRIQVIYKRSKPKSTTPPQAAGYVSKGIAVGI